MPDFSTVECYEAQDSRKENWDGNNSSISVDLIVPWSNRYALLIDLLHNARPFPYNDQLPLPLIAWSAQIQNLANEKQTQDGQAASHLTAVLSVLYRPSSFILGGTVGTVTTSPDGDQVILDETFETVTEFKQLDPKYFSKEQTAIVPILPEDSPGAILKYYVLSRTIHNITTLNTEILTYPGTVNNLSYTSALVGLTFPAQTLLFEDFSLSRSIRRLDPSSFKFNINLRWRYNSLGWNNVASPLTQEVTGGTAEIIYTSAAYPFFVVNPGIIENGQQSGFAFPRFQPYALSNYAKYLW